MSNKKRGRAKRIFGKKKRTTKVPYIVFIFVVLVILAFITYNYMLTCYHFAEFQKSINSDVDATDIENNNIQSNFAYNVEIRSSLAFLEKLKADDVIGAKEIVEQRESFNYVDKTTILAKLDEVLNGYKQLEDLKEADANAQKALVNLADRYYYYQNELRYIFRQSRQDKSDVVATEEAQYIFYQNGVMQGMPAVESVPEYGTVAEIAMAYNLGRKQLQRLTADLSYTKWRVKGMEDEFANLFKLKKQREVLRETIKKDKEAAVSEVRNFALKNMLEQFYQSMPEFLVIMYNFGVDVNNMLASRVEIFKMLPNIAQPQS
jgi:hypothetical protein